MEFAKNNYEHTKLIQIRKINYLDKTIKCTHTANEIYALYTMYVLKFETHSVLLYIIHAQRIKLHMT